MIALLTGTIVEKQAPKLILDVQGVGYEIYVPITIYETLPPLFEKHQLKIIYVKSETSTRLYGFNTYEEKDLFIMLCSVNGIGDRSALKFLNCESAEFIREAIVNEDLKSLTTLSGLGLKTAQRLLIELKEKVMSFTNLGEDIDVDAISALIALGYDERSAKVEIKKVNGPKMKTNDLIQAVLKARS